MLDWSRPELQVLARWRFIHAWDLDEHPWEVGITPDGSDCSRDWRENRGAQEAAEIGRDMMLRS